MIVRTEEEFLNTFKVGDTVYWTAIWKDRPTYVAASVIQKFSDVLTKNPELSEYYNRETHNPKFIVNQYGQDDFISTMTMTSRVCATTQSEAEQGLCMLTWFYENDAKERAEIQERWELERLMWDQWDLDYEDVI